MGGGERRGGTEEEMNSMEAAVEQERGGGEEEGTQQGRQGADECGQDKLHGRKFDGKTVIAKVREEEEEDEIKRR